MSFASSTYYQRRMADQDNAQVVLEEVDLLAVGPSAALEQGLLVLLALGCLVQFLAEAYLVCL